MRVGTQPRRFLIWLVATRGRPLTLTLPHPHPHPHPKPNPHPNPNPKPNQVETRGFDAFILLTILCNCVTMAWVSPLDPPGTYKARPVG